MTGIWLVSYLALWLLFLATAIVLVSMLRNLGVMAEALRTIQQPSAQPIKLTAGEVVPDVPLQTRTGAAATITSFRGSITAFVIVSPQCGPCHALLEHVAAQRALVDPLDYGVQQTVIVSIGAVDQTIALLNQLDVPAEAPLLIDTASRVADRWGISATPTTVIVDPQLRFVRHIAGFIVQEPQSTALQART